TDWKKQAQEEKKRLAEEEQKKRATEASKPAPFAAPPGAAPSSPASSRSAGGARAPREMPEASFPTLVQSTLTQVLFYLGDLATRGAEPMLNLDMAKHHIDTLGMLEDKTKGNLSDDEKRILDAALYEARMRFVSVASQTIP